MYGKTRTINFTRVQKTYFPQKEERVEFWLFGKFTESLPTFSTWVPSTSCTSGILGLSEGFYQFFFFSFLGVTVSVSSVIPFSLLEGLPTVTKRSCSRRLPHGSEGT